MRSREAVNIKGCCRPSVWRRRADCENPLPFHALVGTTRSDQFHKHNTRNQYIKNYAFDFDFGQSYGPCSVTMTCVTGHLTGLEFTSEYKNWSHPPPESLFHAPVVTSIHDVREERMPRYIHCRAALRSLTTCCRTRNP